MKYCKNCGNEINDGEKFCRECGSQIIKKEIKLNQFNENEVRKCPYCGEYLKSLDVTCPSCGQDVRGKDSSASVRDFAYRLSHIESDEIKVTLLRSFPIPNTKEDIFEFMILASTNLEQNLLDNKRENIADAWLTKFEQSYRKAQLLFQNEEEFLKIEKLYETTNERIEKQKNINILLKNIPVIIGIVIMIIAIIIDKAGENSAIWELIAYIVLIVSASTLDSRNARIIEYGIAELSGVLVLVLSSFLYNDSGGILCGGLILIIASIKLFRIKSKNRR